MSLETNGWKHVMRCCSECETFSDVHFQMSECKYLQCLMFIGFSFEMSIFGASDGSSDKCHCQKLVADGCAAAWGGRL